MIDMRKWLGALISMTVGISPELEDPSLTFEVPWPLLDSWGPGLCPQGRTPRKDTQSLV